jgi:hypothetical protein
MVKTVISRLGQNLPRFLTAPSLAGESLLDRLRNSTIALLGVVAAVGLGIVAFAANQGWPEFLNSPFPTLPKQSVGEAQVVAEPAGPTAHPVGRPGQATAVTAGRQGGGGGPAPGRGGSSHDEQHSAVGPAGQTPTHGPGAAEPGSPTAPPVGAPPAPVVTQPPQSTPAPGPSTPPAETPAPGKSPSSPGNGHGKARGHESSSGQGSSGQGSSSQGKARGHEKSSLPPTTSGSTQPPAQQKNAAVQTGAPESAADPGPEPAEPAAGSGHGNDHAYGHK